ncbi:unnamed protein product [Urochloa humidicola]
MLPRSAMGEGDDVGRGSVSDLHRAALLVLGLATASMAVTLASGAPPPPGFARNAYSLALSWVFLAGVAVIYAAVWVSDDPSGRRSAAAGRKLVDASLVPFAVAAVISVVAAAAALL